MGGRGSENNIKGQPMTATCCFTLYQILQPYMTTEKQLTLWH